jgi:hypothetical protein
MQAIPHQRRAVFGSMAPTPLKRAGGSRGADLLDGQPLLEIQAEPAVGRDVMIDQWSQSPPVLRLHRLLVLRLGQHLLIQQRIDVLSRDFVRSHEARFHLPDREPAGWPAVT